MAFFLLFTSQFTVLINYLLHIGHNSQSTENTLLTRAPPIVFELLWKSFLVQGQIRTHRGRVMQLILQATKAVSFFVKSIFLPIFLETGIDQSFYLCDDHLVDWSLGKVKTTTNLIVLPNQQNLGMIKMPSMKVANTTVRRRHNSISACTMTMKVFSSRRSISVCTVAQEFCSSNLGNKNETS